MSQDTEGRPGMPQKERKEELSFCVFLNKYCISEEMCLVP